MASNLLSRGDVFAGRYKIERSIGSGGMGAVFEAEHIETERRVALKVLLPQSLVSETARERFKQEARVAGKLRHPHIVDILDAGVDDLTNMPYLVMEMLQGEDLGSRIQRIGPMKPKQTVALLLQVAGALDSLHMRQVVHRDLKPENLFLALTEEGHQVVKLLDFGVAKVIDAGSSAAFTQDAQGTPVYMAPEQFAEQIRISAATDIYALGMVTFTLLTGKHYWGPEIARGMNVFMLARIAEAGPKEAATVRARRQGATLPPAFDEWFSICTAISPGERYPTATDAVECLADAMGIALSNPTTSGGRSRSGRHRVTPPPPAPLPTPPPPPERAEPDTVPAPPPELEELEPEVSPRPLPLRPLTPLPLPERSVIASTPPQPLPRLEPWWRRPSTIVIALVVVVGLLAAVLLVGPGAPLGEPDSAAVTAASSAPEPPALQPAHTADTEPSSPAASATSQPPPSASTPAPLSPVPPRVPKVSAPATTKRPKYTRE